MKILALEFSSARRSVAVWDDGGSANTAIPLGRAHELAGHRGLGLVNEALEQSGCATEQIDVVAVGLGPGSYTGIRGAIALAQGWQLGRSIRIMGISSVECLAAQAQAEGRRGPVNIIIDAQRNEYYLAKYALEAEAPRETEPLRLATAAEMETLAQAGATLLGPDIRRRFAAGVDMYPDATMLGRLACGRDNFIPGEALEAIYLRETSFKKAPPPREIP